MKTSPGWPRVEGTLVVPQGWVLAPGLFREGDAELAGARADGKELPGGRARPVAGQRECGVLAHRARNVPAPWPGRQTCSGAPRQRGGEAGSAGLLGGPGTPAPRGPGAGLASPAQPAVQERGEGRPAARRGLGRRGERGSGADGLEVGALGVRGSESGSAISSLTRPGQRGQRQPGGEGLQPGPLGSCHPQPESAGDSRRGRFALTGGRPLGPL